MRFALQAYEWLCSESTPMFSSKQTTIENFVKANTSFHITMGTQTKYLVLIMHWHQFMLQKNYLSQLSLIYFDNFQNFHNFFH